MTFKELKQNDKIYAFKENKLIKTFEFKNWLDDKRACVCDTEKLNEAALTIHNKENIVASIQTSQGLIKLSCKNKLPKYIGDIMKELNK